MNDDIRADVGDAADTVTVGKGNQQTRNEPRQTMRAGDINFQSPDSMQIYFKILDMAAQIRELTIQMDDLPNRVTRLERTEVVVRPGPEVIIRKAAPDSLNISVRVIAVIAVLAILLCVALVVVLVLLRSA